MDGTLPHVIVYISLLLLICVVAIALNAMTLMVLDVHFKIRTPQSILLKNLCISDLVYLLGGTVLVLTVAIIHHEVLCFITIVFNSLVMALNVYLVAALSLQRYISLRKFRNNLAVDKKDCKCARLIVFGTWMLAIALGATECILLRSRTLTCLEGLLMGIPLYRLVTYTAVPIAIVIVLDVASTLLPAAHDVPNEARDREIEERRMQLKLVLLCFLTYSPAILLTYVVGTRLGNEYRIVILPLGIILTALNALFRPIVMCVTNKKLRVLFKDYCCCRCSYQQPDTSHQFNLVENKTVLQRGDQTSDAVL